MAASTRRRRILSIAFPHLPTDRIARARWGRSWISDGRPEAPPLAVTDMVQNALRIAALEPGAEALGLNVGQTLADARAIRPDLDAVAMDAPADGALLAAVAGWCERYTPLTGLSAPDGLMLDVSGCAHLLGGEAGLLEDVTARLTAQGLNTRAALAGTPGAAWALARFGGPRIAASGEEAAALAPLPLAALRVAPPIAAGLARVGLRTVGCIADLPRAPLARRFGAGLLTRLDQALGRAEEAISPLRPAPDLAAERRFFDPISHQDDIARATALLAEALAPLLEARGLGARRLELRLFRVDGAVERLAVSAARPLRDPGRIAGLFRDRVAGLRQEIEAGFGFDLVKLAVLESERFGGVQGDMIAGGRAEDGFQALVDRLGARLGPERVRGFAGAETHIPERAFGTLPLGRLRPGTPATGPAAGQPVPPLTRPLWLLARPEPLEALAEVPDGPPLRFRWRRTGYEVARSEGPERIACEWWRDGRGAMTRDYFRVEAREGHRFWMFRHGLYARETVRPRWYMHGVFA
ncbi:DNA polymerase Y family protein [Halovulum dunhuangense]|uniref:DNA polymerase Y family protein n=1 Tax=Halovulum dunhuangense TaxID=1505036 RepID=A0A849L4C1_9RHOB|nr:DNA polymerase Y family protein [Halovulum dunhuangense]NNU81179.1 DNA polymerase Y family protein [Halovulum dunhuangense]